MGGLLEKVEEESESEAEAEAEAESESESEIEIDNIDLGGEKPQAPQKGREIILISPMAWTVRRSDYPYSCSFSSSSPP